MPTRGDGQPAARPRTTDTRFPSAAISACTALCKNEIICMAHKDLHGITMKNIYRSLFLLLVGATQKELARQVRYLTVENQMLRSRLPRRLTITPQERNRLVRFGAQAGPRDRLGLHAYPRRAEEVGKLLCLAKYGQDRSP